MKYYLHILAVSFVTGALLYKSWLLGLCSVMVLALLTGKELYKEYLVSKKETETANYLKQIAKDNEDFRKKLQEFDSIIGKVSYKVNQMGDYLGTPQI